MNGRRKVRDKEENLTIHQLINKNVSYYIIVRSIFDYLNPPFTNQKVYILLPTKHI